jgi:hypothetical protein
MPTTLPGRLHDVTNAANHITLVSALSAARSSKTRYMAESLALGVRLVGFPIL